MTTAEPRPAALRALPHLLTLTNLLCGTAAFALLVSGGSPGIVLTLLAVALVADLLDGRVARALGVSGPLGTVLDSLADLVSFGLVPAAAVALASTETSALSLVAGAAVVGAAGYRLARFTAEALTAPPSTQSGPKAPTQKPSFKGLPVTIPAAILVGAAVSGFQPSPLVLTLTAVLLAGLMVSRVPFRSFKDRPLGLILAPIALLGVGLSIALGSARVGIGAALLLGGVYFVLYGLLTAATRQVTR